MTVEPNVPDTNEPVKQPETDADPATPERDDTNDYAAYWQARSGFFDRVPDADPNPNPP